MKQTQLTGVPVGLYSRDGKRQQQKQKTETQHSDPQNTARDWHRLGRAVKKSLNPLVLIIFNPLNGLFMCEQENLMSLPLHSEHLWPFKHL